MTAPNNVGAIMRYERTAFREISCELRGASDSEDVFGPDPSPMGSVQLRRFTTSSFDSDIF